MYSLLFFLEYVTYLLKAILIYYNLFNQKIVILSIFQFMIGFKLQLV